MLTALLVLGSVCAYFQVGRFIGHKAWKKWHENKRSVSSALLFPVAHTTDKVGDSQFPMIIMDESERVRMVVSCFVWPYRLVWTPFIWSIFVLYKVVSPAFKVLFEPERLFKGALGGVERVGELVAGFRKRLEEHKRDKTAALPETSADELPSWKEELNGLLAEQEVVESRVDELKQKICAEEARRMGTYREAPLILEAKK